MAGESLWGALAHGLMRPVGSVLRAVDPRAYELVRWRMSKSRLSGGLLGKPMYHQLLLPFVVRKGDTVFDVGANTGQYTVPLARLVGATGAVHSFEPISRTFEELRETVAREGLASRVVLNQAALGDVTRELTFTVPRDRLTEATAAPHDAESWADYQSAPWKYTTETCRSITLDEYVAEHCIGDVSFIKCDVEGAELAVMKGARNVLRSARPPVILLEVYEGWAKSFGYHPRDLLGFLSREAGYECYWIHQEGLRRVDPGDAVIPGVFWQWLDYVCVVPDVHSDRLRVERFLA